MPFGLNQWVLTLDQERLVSPHSFHSQQRSRYRPNGRRNDDWNFLEDRNYIPDRVANQAEQLRSSEQRLLSWSQQGGFVPFSLVSWGAYRRAYVLTFEQNLLNSQAKSDIVVTKKC